MISDSDYTIPIWGNIIEINYKVIQPSLTPYKAIYGLKFSNSPHAAADYLGSVWSQVATKALGITNLQAYATRIC